MKYSAYGVPFGLPRGDTDSSGSADAADESAIQGYSGPYDVRYDLNLDGSIGFADEALFESRDGGSGAISSAKSSRGFEGNMWMPGNQRALARYRWYEGSLGRWLSRDPLGYYDGTDLYQMKSGRTLSSLDPFGLAQQWINFPVVVPQVAADYTVSLTVDFGTNDCEVSGGANDPTTANGAEEGAECEIVGNCTEQPADCGGMTSSGCDGAAGLQITCTLHCTTKIQRITQSATSLLGQSMIALGSGGAVGSLGMSGSLILGKTALEGAKWGFGAGSGLGSLVDTKPDPPDVPDPENPEWDKNEDGTDKIPGQGQNMTTVTDKHYAVIKMTFVQCP